MGGDVPKQFLMIGGRPMIAVTLEAFENCGAVDTVVLVTGAEHTEYCRKEIVEKYGFRKVRHIVEGGAERYDSVYAGLLALRDSGCSLVAVQDGARCMVTPDIIRRAYEAAEQYGACVIAVPSKDTIKLADEEGFAAETLPRQRLWRSWAPCCSFTRDIRPSGRASISRPISPLPTPWILPISGPLSASISSRSGISASMCSDRPWGWRPSGLPDW